MKPDHAISFIKKGLIETETLWEIEKVIIAERFGWTLEYIENMKSSDYEKLRAVITGIAKRDSNGKTRAGSGVGA